MARIQIGSGESQAGVGSADLALRHAQAAKNPPLELEAQLLSGHAYLELGEYTKAQRALTSALRLSKAQADTKLPEVLNLLAGASHAAGDYQTSLGYLQELTALHRRTGNTLGAATTLCNLGNLMTSMGQYPEALRALLDAYALIRTQPGEDAAASRLYGGIVLNLGNLHLDMANPAEALGYFEDAYCFAQSRNDPAMKTNALLNQGVAQHELGQAGAAFESYTQALALARAFQHRRVEVSALDGLGRLSMEAGRLIEACSAYQQAGAIAEEISDLEGQLEAKLHLGSVLEQLDRCPEAITTLDDALALAQAVGRPKTVCDLHRALYQLYKRGAHSELALFHLEQLYQQERTLLNLEVEERVLGLTTRFDLERAQHEAELTRLRLVTAEEAREAAEAQVRQRTRSLELAQLEVVTRLAVAAEYRDDSTGEHTWRVGQYCAAIATRLGLPEDEVSMLGTAARLHDVGKIGIPDAILLKAGKLTPEEYGRMKTHAEIGARILSGGSTPLLQMAELIASAHHERWDGAGYPQRLAGAAIPLVARIVAVADVFDALTHVRPYKAAWSAEEALNEIASQAGAQFDPQVVQAALEVLSCVSLNFSREEPGQPAQAV